jgi:hypothetical protein
LLGTAMVAGTAAASAGQPGDSNRPPGGPDNLPFSEQVVSSPVSGGGYPGTAPAPGGCEEGLYDSNFSEASLALRPGSEQLVGGAKAYFSQWSTWKAQHTVSFAIDGGRASTHFVGGYDCVTTGSQDMPPSWTNVTDPTGVWDTKGRVHQLTLPYNAYWGSVKEPNGDVGYVYSDDGGRTWVKGNGGQSVEVGREPSVDSEFYLDKPWIAANQNPSSPWVDHVYGAWVLFTPTGAEVHTGVTRDRGATWTDVANVVTPQTLGPKNPWPMIGVGPDGVVYLTYVSYGSTSADGKTVPATIWLARSTDDGKTWSGFDKVADTTVIANCCVPGTTLHRSIVQYLAVSPDQPGHVYIAWNEVNGGQVDVKLTSSSNGGRTWTPGAVVNDDAVGANQYQATVAAGPGGAVVVGFYDFRANCPNGGSAILRENRGKANTCIGLRLQAYRDTGSDVTAIAGNRLASRHLWDPYQPGQTRDGIKQVACEKPTADCSDIFIGDYFSMQISGRNVYVLSSSTFPPSGVRADGGGQIHYQQQVLTTVQRRHLGL